MRMSVFRRSQSGSTRSEATLGIEMEFLPRTGSGPETTRILALVFGREMRRFQGMASHLTCLSRAICIEQSQSLAIAVESTHIYVGFASPNPHCSTTRLQVRVH